jgi:polyisoprenoid-binding protein YceI
MREVQVLQSIHRPMLFVALIATASACKNPANNATAATVGNALPTAAPTAAPADMEALNFSTPASRVGFVGTKVTGSHEGQFERATGTVSFSPSHPEASRINVDIDMASVSIEPAQLNGHLRSPDFFDVAHFPHSTFVSTEIRPGATAPNTHTITGNLTLHGVTHAVSFPATVTVTPAEVDAVSEFSINRRDFGIVLIRLNIKAPRQH